MKKIAFCLMILALIAATTGMAFASDRYPVNSAPSSQLIRVNWFEYGVTGGYVNYTVVGDIESMKIVLEVSIGSYDKRRYENREKVKKGNTYTAHFAVPTFTKLKIDHVDVSLENVVMAKGAPKKKQCPHRIDFLVQKNGSLVSYGNDFFTVNWVEHCEESGMTNVNYTMRQNVERMSILLELVPEDMRNGILGGGLKEIFRSQKGETRTTDFQMKKDLPEIKSVRIFVNILKQ